jgi:hypothetical protein
VGRICDPQCIFGVPLKFKMLVVSFIGLMGS